MRFVKATLFVGVMSAALAAAGPDALLMFRDAAGAATDVSVAFVVDFSGSGGPVTGCVKVPSSDNGYEALAAFTAQMQEAPPIYNNASLLCSINGVPAGAPAVCGQRTSTGYDFWSYWHGTTGSWVYSSTGAFSTVTTGDVEGWKFQDPGPDNATAPPPGSAPSYASICGAQPVDTTTTAAGPALAAVSTPTTIPASGTAAVAPKPGATVPTTTPTVPSSVSSTSSTNPASIASTAPSTTVPPPANQAQSLRASPTSAKQPGSGSAAPLLVGGVILAALIAGSVFRWRRRPETQ